jgi:hypothetical protein
MSAYHVDTYTGGKRLKRNQKKNQKEEKGFYPASR